LFLLGAWIRIDPAARLHLHVLPAENVPETFLDPLIARLPIQPGPGLRDSGLFCGKKACGKKACRQKASREITSRFVGFFFIVAIEQAFMPALQLQKSVGLKPFFSVPHPKTGWSRPSSPAVIRPAKL